MICPYCNTEISDNSEFCSKCGQKLTNSTKGASYSNYWKEIDKNNAKILKQRENEKEVKNQLKKNRGQKGVVFVVLILICLGAIYYFLRIRPVQLYNQAQQYFNDEKYEEAKSIYEELGNYNDSEEWVEKSNEQIIERDYLNALNTFEKGEYENAMQLFKALNGYKDSYSFISQCEYQAIISANKSDIVCFGSDENGTPVEWVVLESGTDGILLISRYYLFSKIANEVGEDDTYRKYHCWSQSTLRQWLNNDFQNEYFTDNEKDLLKDNIVYTEEYSVDDYDGWNEVEISSETIDKVYIPSVSDVERYRLQPVPLASNPNGSPVEGWLRDRGHGIAFQKTLESDGDYGSEWHFYSSYGIRPIIKIICSDKESLSNGDAEIDNINYSIDIPDGAFEWNGHLYYCYNQCDSWEEAAIFCESVGGHLATILSEEENEAVFEYLNESGNSGGAFFGFTDNVSEGDFYWITGDSTDYINWHSGEPNAENTSEDYAMFYYKFSDGTWNDGRFDSGSVFICEWDVEQ